MLFRKKQRQPQAVPKDLRAPDGTAIKVKDLYFYVKDGKKYQIKSERILKSHSYPRVIEVTVAAANSIPNGIGKIGFREGSVIRSITSGQYFLISNNERRLITSPDCFAQLQIDKNAVILVASEELLLHKVGNDIGRL